MCETTHIKLQPVRRLPTTLSQTTFLRAETGKALTTVLAFIAFTTTVFPNISFFPALVAGFRRVLIMHTPGTVNLPFFFTCSAPRPASPLIMLVHSFLLRPVCDDNASAIAPLVNALLPAAPFIAFIATIASGTRNAQTAAQTN